MASVVVKTKLVVDILRFSEEMKKVGIKLFDNFSTCIEIKIILASDITEVLMMHTIKQVFFISYQ